MSDSGGHWKNLAAAQKLTQSMRIPGVFEEDIKRNNPIERVAVGQAAGTGLKIEWLREKSANVQTLEDAVTEIDIGEQLSWTEDIDYDEVNTELKRSYIQRKLDKFVQGIYGTFNNYEARVLLECEKALKRKLGARLIYADVDTSAKQFDGVHAWARQLTGVRNTDMAEAALSLGTLRTTVDDMKMGVDEMWAPYEIVRRFDAAYQEKGFAGLATATAGTMAFLTMGLNELGKRVLFWDGIPMIRTDFLVAEQANTGLTTANPRLLNSSGDKQYSIFLIKHGNVLNQEPGLTYAFGGTSGFGDFYKLVRFPELEDYDAGGLRMVNYGAVLLGSTYCLGRITDIEDVALVV